MQRGGFIIVFEKIRNKVVLILKKELELYGATVIDSGKLTTATFFRKPTISVMLSNFKYQNSNCEFNFLINVIVPIKQKSKLDECVWLATKSIAQQTEFNCTEIKIENAKFGTNGFVEQKIECNLISNENFLLLKSKNAPEVILQRASQLIGKSENCKIVADYPIEIRNEFGSSKTKFSVVAPSFTLELKNVFVSNLHELLKIDNSIEVKILKHNQIQTFYDCVITFIEKDFKNEFIKSLKLVSCNLKVG